MMEPAKTALLLVDLQNDFVHADGALGRAKAHFNISGLTAPLQSALAACRAKDVLIVSLHYTVPKGRGGASMFRPDFKRAVPILRDGDFAAGSFGHQLAESFGPSDIAVEKVFPSAFVQSRLQLELELNGVETILLAGITTNVGVAATFHDARPLGFHTLVLGDCCAARSLEAHAATLVSIKSAAYAESTVINALALETLFDA